MIIESHDITLRADLRSAGFTEAEQAQFFAALDKDFAQLSRHELDLLNRHEQWRQRQQYGPVVYQ